MGNVWDEIFKNVIVLEEDGKVKGVRNERDQTQRGHDRAT